MPKTPQVCAIVYSFFYILRRACSKTFPCDRCITNGEAHLCSPVLAKKRGRPPKNSVLSGSDVDTDVEMGEKITTRSQKTENTPSSSPAPLVHKEKLASINNSKVQLPPIRFLIAAVEEQEKRQGFGFCK